LTGKIFLKLIAGVFCLLLLALITVDYSASEVARDASIQNLIQQLAEKGRMTAISVGDPSTFSVERARAMAAAAGGRLTIVRADGKVLVDSEADAAGMENHRTPDRPELMQAFRGTVGWKIRHSATIGIDFLYVAVPSRDGAIRIAVPLSEIDRQANRVRGKILVSTALAFLPAIAIAALFSRWISGRFATIMSHAGELARGNFHARLTPGRSEFGQLGHTLNELSENLQKTVEQLQREHAELERVERVRKDFVINVSHELRTPLASIQGYTETLIDGALNDPTHNMRFLRIIRHNAERLARITEDLLTLSRIEQRRQKFEFEPHSVNGLLHEAIESIRPIAQKNDLRLELEEAPEDAEAWCDSEAVSQILSNLLDNAIKYTPAGGRITVGAHPAGEYMEIFVRDTGIGIPPEELPRLFERFYRVDKARSRELGGTGLGLSIVKHLVAAHNGSARVESHVGKGSTFFFTLPVDEPILGHQQLNPEFTAS
jgi:two-component system phosphate regulon sensor histidine kinase PhoR